MDEILKTLTQNELGSLYDDTEPQNSPASESTNTDAATKKQEHQESSNKAANNSSDRATKSQAENTPVEKHSCNDGCTSGYNYFLWAVLFNRKQMATQFWKQTEEPIS